VQVLTQVGERLLGADSCNKRAQRQQTAQHAQRALQPGLGSLSRGVCLCGL